MIGADPRRDIALPGGPVRFTELVSFSALLASRCVVARCARAAEYGSLQILCKTAMGGDQELVES